MKQEILLEIKNIDAQYKNLPVLHDVSVAVDEGEVIAVMGPNGAGKSTVLKAIFGLVEVTAGDVLYHGTKLKPKPHQMVERGIAFVPQGRRVFTHLTVLENLEIGGHFLHDRAEVKRRIEEVLKFFPPLRAKLKEKSGSLSGGQQQMLAMARGLMTNPSVLLLDEPTLGLSPKIVKEMFETIKEINRDRKTAMVIVEHNIKSLLPITDRVYVLEKGKLVYHGSADAFQKTDLFEKVFLGHTA